MISSILILFVLLTNTIYSQSFNNSRHLPLEYRSLYSNIQNNKQLNSHESNKESFLSKIAWIIR